MASTIGIMQALISVFLDDNDKLRSINAGRTRITFLLRPPLYYVGVSSWGEPESVVCFPLCHCWSGHLITRLVKEDKSAPRVSAFTNSQHRQRGTT